MSPLTFSRAAVAAGLLASTVSAAFDAGSTTNVAMYWGQGGSQIPLSQVCSDPSIDIVNIAFVNGFPQNVGDYPKTNFANACYGYYPDPHNSTANSGLLQHCNGVEQAINDCQAAGKKVLLSLGGGAPTDYYLPSQAVAEDFAEFLLGAFGPLTEEWKTAGKPRPFGAAAIDGFDLDLEADAAKVPSPEYLYMNYDHFVTRVKTLQPGSLISGAPQCVTPDARLAYAISKVHFDFIFTQFYNTYQCSAALGYKDIDEDTTGFSFDAWVDWLTENSAHKGVKLYMGLPAGPGALPVHTDHYLKPEEANALITKYQKKWPGMFGGVMLWEATVSVRNPTYGQSFGYWMKAAVEGTFLDKYTPVVSSSSLAPSSTPVASSRISSSTRVSSSSARISSSSTRISTSRVRSSSSTRASSSRVQSSTARVSSSVRSSSAYIASSTVRSSSAHVTSSAVSSSVYSTSSPAASSSSSHYGSSLVRSSSSAQVSSSLESSSDYSTSTPASSSSSSVHSASSVYSSSAAQISSSASVQVPSSTYPASSQASSSSYSHGASSVYPASSPTPSSSYVQVSSSSSVHLPSSAPASSQASSSVYSAHVPSSLLSSAVSSSAYVASSSVHVPHPSESLSYDYSSSPSIVLPVDATKSIHPTGASSSTGYSSVGNVESSAITAYPADTTKSIYPTGASSHDGVSTPIDSSALYPANNASSTHGEYPTDYPEPTPQAASSTPCTTTSMGYPAQSSSVEHPVYPASSKSHGHYHAHPSESSQSHSHYHAHPAQSSKSQAEYAPFNSGKGYDSYPSVTQKPEYPEGSPSYPTGTTTSVITTTYVDVCSTGLTTITTTIIKTVCNSCAKPTKEPEYPKDWTTSVYVDKTVTLTITKPIHPATDAPAHPSSASEVYAVDYSSSPKPSSPSYGSEKPEAPVYEGETPEKPSKPEQPTHTASSKSPGYPANSQPSKAAEYPAQPESSKAPGYSAHLEGPKAPEHPAYSESAKTPGQPASSQSTKAPEYPVQSDKPQYPKKPVEAAEDITSTITQVITLTKVPASYTAAPYPSAPAPAHNGTSAYAPIPTGTGKPTMPSSYVPSEEFEGSASRFGVGLTVVVGVVAGLLVL